MFDPRKTGSILGSPGAFGVILAALISLSLLSQLLSSGTAPMLLLGLAALFAFWWLYNRFIKKELPNDFAKYKRAVKRQKKNGPPVSSNGKVIYLKNIKRK